LNSYLNQYIGIAIAHSWPAHVYVQICYGGNFYLPEFTKNYTISECFTCGGTLIDKTTVLTAAHCILDLFQFSYRGIEYSFPTWSNDLYPTNGSMYKLYLGIQNINEMSYMNSDYVINASRVIRHENYSNEYQLNDIAMFKLSKPVNLNQNVQVACLPTNRSINYPPVNESVYAIGWGLAQENDFEISQELRNVKLTHYNASLCDDVLPLVPKNWTIEMCAGYYNGGKDTCQGDSGGPLYYLDIINNKAKYILVGITSYGDGCARYGYFIMTFI
jgi:secreted trypsin-like serine protease